MGKNKNPNIQPFLYEGDCSGRFIMLPPDLFESGAFQGLSHAARAFYLCIAAHTATDFERQACFSVMKQYGDIMGHDWDDGYITEKVGGHFGKKTYHTKLFIFPDSHAKNYGYSASYSNKLKSELIEKGFIKIKYAGKGRYTGWSKNATIYAFSNRWKGQEDEEEN